MRARIECEYRPDSNDFRINLAVPDTDFDFETDVPASEFRAFMATFASNPSLQTIVGADVIDLVRSVFEKEYQRYAEIQHA